MKCSKCGQDLEGLLLAGGVCPRCDWEEQRKVAFEGDGMATWNGYVPVSRKPLEYLAAPYTHESPIVQYERFNAINQKAAELFKFGRHIYSPMSHTLPIAIAGDIHPSFEFWREFDERMMSLCDRLLVLCLPGWKESVGVKAEINMANKRGMPIEYIDLKNG